MYVCIYVHTYVCTYVRTYACMYTCTYIHTYIHINAYKYVLITIGTTVDCFEEDCFATPDEASKEFETILSDIAEELDKCIKENLEKIFCHLTDGQNVPLLSKEDIHCVTTCKSVYEMFSIMQPYWNWYSNRLLLSIINVVDSVKSQEILKRFKKKIDYTMKLKIIYAKFQERKKLPVPQGYRKMTAIVDKNYSEITLQEWSEIELCVFHYLDLPQPPSEIKESQYIEVTWYICMEAVDSLRSKAFQHREDLQLKSFLFLQVDDHDIFSTRRPSLSEVRMCFTYLLLHVLLLLKHKFGHRLKVKLMNLRLCVFGMKNLNVQQTVRTGVKLTSFVSSKQLFY